MLDYSPYLFALLTFGAVTAVAFVVGQYFLAHVHLRQRAGAPGRGEAASGRSVLLDEVNAFVATYFDQKKFQIEGPVRQKLRLDLVRAGFFSPDAINYYIFARLTTVIVLPVVTYLVVQWLLYEQSWLWKMLIVAIVTVLAILGPDGYIARRQRILADRYRTSFPDVLDLMVVCVDAGLGLDAALDRLSQEMTKRNRELGMNLLIVGAETRAGRSTADALASFAERLGLDEARSFVATLRQSIELGTDVGDALRAFSSEMRDRRVLRAEERASQLPVKMVAPLGLFIFPVILMVVMLPIILKLLTVMR